MRTIAALAFAALMAAPAVAADFTLHVPVHIQNLHSATRFYVNCSVVPAGGGSEIANFADMSGTPITGGNYDGTITVTLNAPDPDSARRAASYSCSLSVMAVNPHAGTSTRTNVASYSGSTSPNPNYASATGQNLASVQGEVSGPLH